MKGMEKDIGMDIGEEPYKLSHRRVCEADLPPSTEIVAHRLLLLAESATGQVNMTWEELSELTGCNNVGAARRHLSRLSAAKLIHYSTNDFVYVTWLAWVERAQRARPRAAASAWTRRSDEVVEHEVELFGDTPALPPARGRAGRIASAQPAARGRAAHSHARLFVSQSVDPAPDTGTDKLTDSPDRSPDEQRRSVALLMDAEVGLDLGVAWEFARRYPFEVLSRQVMTWRRQLGAGMVKDSGALVHRIREGFGATVTEQDRKTDLYRRHHDWKEDERAKKGSYSLEAYLDGVRH